MTPLLAGIELYPIKQLTSRSPKVNNKYIIALFITNTSKFGGNTMN